MLEFKHCYRTAGRTTEDERNSPVKIAIIGAGSVGSTLGAAWGRRDHDITYGVRQPDTAKYASLGAPVTTNAEAVRGADVVVLCTPWQGTRRAIADCGDLVGKVLMDCTNPLTPDVTSLEVGHTTSGAEQVAGWASGARVCKAMNQIGAPMMDAPPLDHAPVMFVCGDDGAAKELARRLVTELGFEVVDAGDLTLARLLEPYALIWIHLALRRGFGTGFGFGLLRADGDGRPALGKTAVVTGE
jgi:8-hydroxy-5-deazaflavin:NADPH oxidoreductase